MFRHKTYNLGFRLTFNSDSLLWWSLVSQTQTVCPMSDERWRGLTSVSSLTASDTVCPMPTIHIALARVSQKISQIFYFVYRIVWVWKWTEKEQNSVALFGRPAVERRMGPKVANRANIGLKCLFVRMRKHENQCIDSREFHHNWDAWMR